MLEDLNVTSFAEVMNTRFRTRLGASNVIELELVEVNEVNRSPRQEAFSITFRGPLDRRFEQGTRDLEHERLGVFALFLVPIAIREDGMYYEAVINRLHE
jgi:uncharacterized protein DUF6916